MFPLLLASCSPSSSEAAASVDVSTCSLAPELKQSLEMIASARKGYESPLSEGEILALAGYKNGDSIEADCDSLLRLLQGAFSSLMEKAGKVGSRLYMGYYEESESNSDDPKGKAAHAWLSSYGLWGKEPFLGSEKISLQTTRTLLQRIFSYLGAAPQEDYFTYANSDRLFDPSVLTGPGDDYYVQKIVEQANIEDFYLSFLNQDSPSLYADFSNGVGLGGLKGYADKIKGASASSFWEVMKEVSSSSGAYLFSLNGFFAKKEGEAHNRISLSDKDALKALKRLVEKPSSLNKLFASFGYDASSSASLTNDLISYFEAIDPLAPEMDPSSISEGLASYIKAQVGESYAYSFSGGNLMKTITYLGHDLNEGNLPEAKAFSIAMLAYAYRALLDKDARAELDFASGEDRADFLSLTSNALQCYFVNAYSSSAEGKKSYAKANELGKKAVSLIEERLPQNAWLSLEGQKAVSDKLSQLEFVVGATSEAHPSFSLSVDASSLEKALGTGMVSYWENIREDGAKIGDADMLSFLYDDILMPNAMYDFSNNSVDITLGLLTSYGGDLSSLGDEIVYGAFLTALTHEITHSIDSSGIYYDGEGKKVDGSILGETDIASYEAKQEKVKALHAYETLPGCLQDSDTTLSEDIADFSALAIAEKIYAEKASSPDWESFYKSIARHFYSVCSYSSWETKYHTDVHSFGKPRVNSLFANSPNFASFYNVSELNGMYAAPSAQVVVW